MFASLTTTCESRSGLLISWYSPTACPTSCTTIPTCTPQHHSTTAQYHHIRIFICTFCSLYFDFRRGRGGRGFGGGRRCRNRRIKLMVRIQYNTISSQHQKITSHHHSTRTSPQHYHITTTSPQQNFTAIS